MKLRVFLKNNKYEFLALTVNVLVAGVVFRTIPQFVAFIISLVIFISSTFFIIYFRTKDRNFYYYPFDAPGQDQDWVGTGDLNFVRNERCFQITNSFAGFILPKTFNWDDYKYKLDFKITNISLGFIVRAANLSNYVMFQIFADNIKPHIRINGEFVELDLIKFDNNFKLDIWHKLTVFCEKRNIRIIIQDKNNSIDRTFTIPVVIDANVVEKIGDTEKITKKIIQNIDFDFGAVGIRNFSVERALIKNIFVEKL